MAPGKRLYLGEGRVLAEVQVPAEVAVPADDFGEHVGTARVPKLGFFRELAHLNEAQQVPAQFVHLVGYVGIQRQNLQE